MPDTSVQTASGDIEAWRTVSQRVGQRAKCSFLLSVLSSDTTTASERAVAFTSLVDDIEGIAEALDQNDYVRFLAVVQEVIQANASEAIWSTTSYPDESICGAESIDGTNVQRVVVKGGVAKTTDVARLDIPGGRTLTVASEYTFVSDDPAVLEVVDDTTGRVLGTARLGRGHNQIATCVIQLGEADEVTRVGIRIMNGSEGEAVLWYQSTLYLSEADRARASSKALRTAIDKHRGAASPASVFTPITGEPLTLQDIDRLTALRNKFWGERIFIMGNGPSLNRTPLELLENDYVFGVNRVSLLFDRVSWRPTFFTAFDVRVVPDNKAEFAGVDVPYKFFSARYKTMMGERENHFWYHTKGHYQGFEASFEPTVTYSGFGGGGTIGVIAIELAFFMGFREIYLIGTDVSYSVPKTVKQAGLDQFGDGVKLELESTRDDDHNHFDPSYFGKNKKWHNPNVREMKIGFARAAAYIERRGGVLRNATVGGELTEVDRVDFDSLF